MTLWSISTLTVAHTALSDAGWRFVSIGWCNMLSSHASRLKSLRFNLVFLSVRCRFSNQSDHTRFFPRGQATTTEQTSNRPITSFDRAASQRSATLCRRVSNVNSRALSDVVPLCLGAEIFLLSVIFTQGNESANMTVLSVGLRRWKLLSSCLVLSCLPLLLPKRECVHASFYVLATEYPITAATASAVNRVPP